MKGSAAVEILERDLFDLRIAEMHKMWQIATASSATVVTSIDFPTRRSLP